jgi:hypothetical protein
VQLASCSGSLLLIEEMLCFSALSLQVKAPGAQGAVCIQTSKRPVVYTHTKYYEHGLFFSQYVTVVYKSSVAEYTHDIIYTLNIHAVEGNKVGWWFILGYSQWKWGTLPFLNVWPVLASQAWSAGLL